MKVDVVVCTKNNEETIGVVMERITKYIPLSRLILVDRGSDDETLTISEGFGAEVYSVGRRELGYARNMALEIVETPIFAFIDADTLITKGWFKLIRHFQDPKVAVANGFIFFGVENPMLRSLWDNQIKYLKIKYPSFSNALVSARHVVEVGGVREVLPSCEDIELMERVIAHGFKWIMDWTIHAYDHKSPRAFLGHNRWWGRGRRVMGASITGQAKVVVTSVVPGVKLLVKAHPALLIYYPLARLYYYLGYLEEAHAQKSQESLN